MVLTVIVVPLKMFLPVFDFLHAVHDEGIEWQYMLACVDRSSVLPRFVLMQNIGVGEDNAGITCNKGRRLHLRYRVR